MTEERNPQSFTQPLVFEGRRPDGAYTANQQHIEPNRYSDPTSHSSQYNQRPSGYVMPRSLAPPTVDSPNPGIVYYGYRDEAPQFEESLQNTRNLVDNQKKVTRYVQHFSSDEEAEDRTKSRSRTYSQLSRILAYLNLQRKLLFWLFAVLLLIIVALLGVIVELK